MGLVRSSTNSTSWGAYSSAAITALETIQIHKQSMSNQVPIHSWVERVHLQVKCLAQGHSAALRQLRAPPATSRSKLYSRGAATVPQRPACIMEYCKFYVQPDIGTLGAVTARDLVMTSSVVLLCLTQSQWDGERYTVSNVEGREINLHNSASPTTGLEARPPACSLL